MRALKKGHMECVKVLLYGGADVNVQDKVSVISYEEATVRVICVQNVLYIGLW